MLPHDAPRTERGLVRAQRRPRLPRGQFPGPWLFSTAEARTSNNSPSPARHTSHTQGATSTQHPKHTSGGTRSARPALATPTRSRTHSLLALTAFPLPTPQPPSLLTASSRASQCRFGRYCSRSTSPLSDGRRSPCICVTLERPRAAALQLTKLASDACLFHKRPQCQCCA